MIGLDFDLTPEESIKYLEGKGYRLTYHYKELMREAHHKAFTVAKVTRLDLLYDIHQSLIDAKRRGIGFSDWKKEIKPTLQKYGWLGKTEVIDPRTGEIKTINVGARRLKTIFATNDRVAYMVAQRQELMEDDLAPYWAYKSALLENTRASHAALHNRVYHRDDPFWDTWYPPNAWNCQCYVVSLSKRQAESGGYKTNKPYLPNTDKDWSYNVGATDALISVTDGIYNKTIKALRETRQGEWGQDWAREHLTKVLEAAREVVDNERYAKWIDSFYDKEGKRLDKVTNPINYMAIGAMSIRVFDFLDKIGRTPKTAPIVITKSGVTHATRAAKSEWGVALTKEQMLAIPNAIKKPKAILWDTQDPAALYAFDASIGKSAKLVIRVNYRSKAMGGKTINEFTTAGVMETHNLKEARYRLIDGNLD